MALGFQPLPGESWRDCVRRLGRKYGYEFEVMEAFDKNLAAGDSEAAAAFEACSEFDVCELT
jgi:hypothetical protein